MKNAVRAVDRSPQATNPTPSAPGRNLFETIPDADENEVRAEDRTPQATNGTAAAKIFDSSQHGAEDRAMRFFLCLLASAMLCACGTPYGHHGSLGGVKIWEHPNNKVEVMVIGRHRSDYERLAQTWKRKADEVASIRGATRYDILSFSTGREFLGVEVMGEGSNVERYSDDTVFWLPKIARGVIRLHDPKPRGWSRTAVAHKAPPGFTP